MNALVLHIASDHGGFLRWLYPAVRYYIDAGYSFVIDGLCASACTLVLAAPPDRICAAPGGMFGFHAALDAFGTALLWASYPAKVRARLGALTTRVVYVRADELVEKCE